MNRVLPWILLLVLGLATAVAAKPASVVFLSPGHADEPFWVTYIQFMQAAADDLGVQLQVLHGARDPERLLDNARQVLASKNPPDYLVFVNERYVGPELLRLFAHKPVKLFSLHSTLTAEQQSRVGGTREHYPNWIGSLVPDDEKGGYLMGQALITLAKGQPWTMLAFSGGRDTPSASLREAGLTRALAEHPEIKLQQLVYGEWQRARAHEQGLALLRRYPQTQLIWAANDEMAFGVMQAARELGRLPGQDLHLSALNNSAEVLRAHLKGEIEVLVTGHFTLGGWAMVLLHDYHAGLDFAGYGGKDRVLPLFMLLGAEQSARLSTRLGRADFGLDFKRFSRFYRPKLSAYDFSLSPLLR
ncbi:MAG: ABC transporter substrate-binding protein [Pseudomonas sp.]|uniref:ABC transporter substrate-binding protein n=1 Tax=Pseudomonas sp. TaxID=306 RepID=UPI0033987145